MKKVVLALAISTFSVMPLSAYADDTNVKSTSSVTGVTAASLASNGNQQMYNINMVPEVQTINTNQNVSGGTNNSTSVSGTQTLKTAPPVYAPNIITSNDTCMGSTSIGASGVGFGISFGSSWTDDNCIMLKNSREMFNMGMQDASFARMCMDKLNREAIELTGKICPQTVREEKAKAEKQAAAQ